MAALSLGAAAGPSSAQRAPGLRATEHASGATTPPDALACPAGTLPDGDACVRWLEPGEGDVDGPDLLSEVGGHHDRRGRWVVYDQIPRRPDRSPDYDAYRYPVPCDRGCVVSGYDLDRDDGLQRRGRRLTHVGHGAVDIPEPKGTPVSLVALEHQVGDAAVLFAGPLFGTTVITRHTVHEGGHERDYLLLYGHLDATAAGVHPGALLAAGDAVGYVGDTGSPELVHLHLEARRVRDGVDVTKLAPEGLVANENT
ncbi:MAG: peptidoglycan DD-metalloendopeptidase family protein, partial [Polyangiaceae bacterium]